MSSYVISRICQQSYVCAAAKPFIPGNGDIADPFQKRYNKDAKRSIQREFDAQKYFKDQKRKANSLDQFFAVAQNEKHNEDGVESFTPDSITEAFGTPLPKAKRYRYRGVMGACIIQGYTLQHII